MNAVDSYSNYNTGNMSNTHNFNGLVEHTALNRQNLNRQNLILPKLNLVDHHKAHKEKVARKTADFRASLSRIEERIRIAADVATPRAQGWKLPVASPWTPRTPASGAPLWRSFVPSTGTPPSGAQTWR